MYLFIFELKKKHKTKANKHLECVSKTFRVIFPEGKPVSKPLNFQIFSSIFLLKYLNVVFQTEIATLRVLKNNLTCYFLYKRVYKFFLYILCIFLFLLEKLLHRGKRQGIKYSSHFRSDILFTFSKDL